MKNRALIFSFFALILLGKSLLSMNDVENFPSSLPVLAKTKVWTYDEYLNTPDNFFDELGPQFTYQDRLSFANVLWELKDNCATNEEDFAKLNRNERVKIVKQIVKHIQKDISDELLNLQQSIEEEMQRFVKLAHEADPEMSDRDVYRAKTNAWPLFNLQALFGKKVENTGPILGFSMLYPLTDDIMDDMGMDKEVKKDFILRFGRLIAEGESPLAHPKNPREQKIWRMFHLIEEGVDRGLYPGAYKAMSDLHNAQIKSAIQQPSPEEGIPSEEAIFPITIEKGAGSIFSDGYIIEGNLSFKQAEFVANFGSITQFINDIHSVKKDLEEGQYTPFNLTYRKGEKLDKMMNKIFRYINNTFRDYEKNVLHDSPISRELSKHMAFYLSFKFIEEIAINNELFSEEYIKKIEDYIPLSMSSFKRLLKKQYS
jgi:actin-related protein